ncbi:ThiF family adenylyltransferase [Actinospica durhamensis]|uniref:ThiF family adenylyltransferase n=1 Tax=Actinospica durhamensis TaxID=1508375 RepID=A0A941EVZ6_9ACTN|nr:ThiF family adenylyltransferase [Actinospica durhamensis]MBR7838298.1 ThiF family adenylyltransferase [Actinospica durhamensis]
MVPKLKHALWEREGADVRILVEDPVEQIVLTDGDGRLERLLELLQEGKRPLDELVVALNAVYADAGTDAEPEPGTGTDAAAEVTRAELEEALSVLDGLGLVFDASPDGLTPWQRERYSSNLEFFATYASLARRPAEFQWRLLDAQVVLLGVGGASAALQALCGLGVGRLRLVDFDLVESKNLVRQFTYRTEDIGRPKVERAAEWVRAFNPEIEVEPVFRRIAGPQDVPALIEGADLVLAGIDQPVAASDWVEEACVAAGVPYVSGSGQGSQLAYWSVDPGRSACRRCATTGNAARMGDLAGLLGRLSADRPVANRSTGPVVMQLMGMVTLEIMRYLTRFAEPVSAGRYHIVDLTTGRLTELPWEPVPDCPTCAKAPTR